MYIICKLSYEMVFSNTSCSFEYHRTGSRVREQLIGIMYKYARATVATGDGNSFDRGFATEDMHMILLSGARIHCERSNDSLRKTPSPKERDYIGHA